MHGVLVCGVAAAAANVISFKKVIIMLNVWLGQRGNPLQYQGQTSFSNPIDKAGRTPLPGDGALCEQVPAMLGTSDRSSGHRVLLREYGYCIPDRDVPSLAEKDHQWDILCAPDPQLTPTMVIVADILYRNEPRVLRILNTYAVARGLGGFDHVSSAINRAYNKYISALEADEI